ncbi:phage major capsid protein [Catenulispora sp. NL8]|uniref:Phage major capsid protein n=1 Tax=Catenulispora pinistramenti TaxID=2705254 RepID=A0ABS5KS08_9ACTN|nr:phage major capsid protein [Catenulispora pinistramenti]MBS2548805.1 phage major capsid protein [Catenulispora pinistramenti]
MRDLINRLLERRAELKTELDAVLVAPTTENRDLNDTESQRFTDLTSDILKLDARISELHEQVTRDEAAAETARRLQLGATVQVTREPETYRRGGQRSYFRDLYLAREKGDRDAFERLERNNRQRADTEQRAINTTNGAGGEFVPPLWLEDEFVAFVRPGRISANLCRHGDVPPGTDSINIPKVNTGTAVAPQTNQNTGVQQTDLTTTSVSSPVVTIAGGQTVSLQLIEQSPLNIDEVVLSDLAQDYAQKLNTQVLLGPGTAGTVTGLLTLAGTQAVTYTSGTPTLAALYSKIAGAIQGIHTSRFLPPTAIVMHPRRWAWAEAQLDGNSRPLIVPAAGGPFNVAGNLDQQAAQGLVGQMLGLPVYVDALIPTNLGAATNQDEVYVAKMDDLWLWEGDVRAEAFQQTYANNMSVFVRLYNYMSFQAARYPQSIATINGTGLTAPVF